MFLNYTLLCSLLFLSFSMATEVTLKPYEGDEKKFILPFPYYQKQKDDHLVYMDQGSYHVFDLEKDKNDVAVIGPLNPCVGVVVTDGKKVIAFHKHPNNAILIKISDSSDKIVKESMEGIIKENLSLDDKSTLFARLFSAHDAEKWEREGIEKEDVLLVHNNKSHKEALRDITSFLKTLGFQEQNIVAQLFSLQTSEKKMRYSPQELGLYSSAENTVSVAMHDVFTFVERKEKQKTKTINFLSFSLFKENVLGLDPKHKLMESMKGTKEMCQRYEQSFWLPTLTYSFCGYLLEYKQCMSEENGRNYQRAFNVDRETFLSDGVDFQKKISNYCSRPFFKK